LIVETKVRYLSVVSLVMALLTGCTATTGGSARPASSAAARTLTGPTIKQALLDGAALAKLLNQPFLAAPKFPEFGGAEHWAALGNRPCPPTAWAWCT
jgi:hypothetical protein